MRNSGYDGGLRVFNQRSIKYREKGKGNRKERKEKRKRKNKEKNEERKKEKKEKEKKEKEKRKKIYLELAVPHILPIQALEPLVLLDILCPTLKVPHTFRAICRQQFLDKILCVGIKVRWELDFASQDFLVNSERIVIKERRVSI